MLRARILFAALFIALPSGCDRANNVPAPAKVTVLAAASTTGAIETVARRFEEKNAAIKIEISTGPSSGLARQVLAGAPASVFLSANKEWAGTIKTAGLAGETVELLSNRLVLIVPAGNPAGITQLSDLLSEQVGHVALAGENVPAGIYAEQALRKLELFDALQESNKLARGSDVRITLSYVERAEVEAGIVYETDARAAQQVEMVTVLDAQSYESVVYPAVLLEAASSQPASREFFKFLQSAEAQATFVQFGFTSLLSHP